MHGNCSLKLKVASGVSQTDVGGQRQVFLTCSCRRPTRRRKPVGWMLTSGSEWFKGEFLEKSGTRSNVVLTSVIWLCGECSLWVIGFSFDLGKLAGSLSTLEDSCLMLWNTIKPNLGCIKDWQTCHLQEVFVAGASHQQTVRVVSTSSALYKNNSAEAEGLFLFPRLFNRKLGGFKPF